MLPSQSFFRIRKLFAEVLQNVGEGRTSIHLSIYNLPALCVELGHGPWGTLPKLLDISQNIPLPRLHQTEWLLITTQINYGIND